MFNSNKLYDKAFRQQLRADPKQALLKLSEAQQDYDYVVRSNSKTTFYFVIPNQPLTEADLLSAQAAASANFNNVGTAGSFGSLGSLGSVTSTIGCMGSIGSVGSAGSANFHADV